MILIGQAFPYFLAFFAAIALCFHPVQGARAVLFFAFGYFSTDILYQWGLFQDYDTRYHPLIFASVITILLYHSLDITPGIFVAWVIELLLIILNMGRIWGISAPWAHWQITVVLNLCAFGALLWSWWHGNRHILYSKFFNLDIPLGFIGTGYRLVNQKSDSGPEAQG